MGLGAKLLKARLGNATARGPLQAQDQALDMLRQRLAQSFSLDQIEERGEQSRQSERLSANIASVEDPQRVQELGVDPAVTRRNRAQREAMEAQADIARSEADVATSTIEERIRLMELQTEQAAADLGITDLRAKELRLRNDWTEAQYVQFLEMAPLLKRSQELANQLDEAQLDIQPILARQARTVARLNQARAGELDSEAEFNRARADLMRLEETMMETMGSNPQAMAMMDPRIRISMGNFANSLVTRGQSALEDFNPLLQNAMGGNERAVDALLSQTDLFERDPDTARRIRQVLLDFDPEGFWTTTQLPLVDQLAQALKQEGMDPDMAQAAEILQHSFMRKQGVSPRAFQGAKNFTEGMFSQQQEVGVDQLQPFFQDRPTDELLDAAEMLNSLLDERQEQ